SSVAHRASGRPRLVIGFAAETDDVIGNAQAKRIKKGCDWIVANDVSTDSGVMGGDMNTVHLVTASGVESWPAQAKDQAARTLLDRVAAALHGTKPGLPSFASFACRTPPIYRCRLLKPIP